MGGDVLVLGLEVLPLHKVGVADVESGLAEGASIEIFRFDSGHVTCVSWDLRDGFLFIDSLKLVIDFFGDVTG